MDQTSDSSRNGFGLARGSWEEWHDGEEGIVMPSKKYVLKLSPEERSVLERVVAEPRAARWKMLRARALLKCDQGPDGPAWSDARIAEALECTTHSLENWRKQAVLQGPLSLLEKQPSQRQTPPKLAGEGEARLMELACSPAPRGHARWTLRLLAEHLVSLEVVDSISHETVRQVLKKTTFSRGGSKGGAFRPSTMRLSSPRWNRCWRSTSGLMIRGAPSSAWTNSPSS